MMTPILTLVLAIAPAALLAETPMTAAEFEKYVTGRTLSYGVTDEPYGAESYHPGRGVTWTFLDGECEHGYWYPDEEAICFVYEFEPDPQCWVFYDEPGGLRAEFLGADGLSTLYQVDDLDEGPICPGPDVGV